VHLIFLLLYIDDFKLTAKINFITVWEGKMNMYYFGAMNEYIESGYAPTDRAKCKSCKTQIEKDSLRMGIIQDDDHFSGKYWYHLDCFTLKPRFKELDPEQQIYNLDHLEEEDMEKVL